MTIVESFEKAPIENMISVLAAKPDKVVFIGDAAQMKNSVQLYRKLLIQKGISTEIILQGIRKNDLDDILKVLTLLVQNEKEIIFDITGGEDLVLFAFGIIYERYKEKRPVKLQRFHVNTGKVADCDGDEEVSFEGRFTMNINDMISLYGGVVVPEEPQPFSENAMEIVDKIWDLARKNSAKWNRAHSFLKEFERKLDISEEVLEVRMNLEDASSNIGDYDKKYRELTKFLMDFYEVNLINNLEVQEGYINYDYSDVFVKRCLTNAGDALEMKCYCEALELRERCGPYFNDCYVGVTIDWDGIIHPKDENWQDTTNEIDLILMRGLIPTFISCKNGKIGEEELYKLHTVAERFGGKYAKKMLIATKLEKESYVAKKAYMQRAKDMGIILITNAGEMTKEDWKKIYKQL